MTGPEEKRCDCGGKFNLITLCKVENDETDDNCVTTGGEGCAYMDEGTCQGIKEQLECDKCGGRFDTD